MIIDITWTEVLRRISPGIDLNVHYQMMIDGQQKDKEGSITGCIFRLNRMRQFVLVAKSRCMEHGKSRPLTLGANSNF